MQWEVDEQCVKYEEWAFFQPFIVEGKPVFHIEYSPAAPKINAPTKSYCAGAGSQGFSSILKDMALDEAC